MPLATLDSAWRMEGSDWPANGLGKSRLQITVQCTVYSYVLITVFDAQTLTTKLEASSKPQSPGFIVQVSELRTWARQA